MEVARKEKEDKDMAEMKAAVKIMERREKYKERKKVNILYKAVHTDKVTGKEISNIKKRDIKSYGTLDDNNGE